MDLNLIWFVLLGVLLAGYAVLDGFDLGAGILHPLARTDQERRLVMGAIGPLWDGNEVWLITFGGALFAAFPDAYATIFSAFYTAFMLLLFCLIFRGVSLEFRNKVQSPQWRAAWDVAFFAASLLASFLFGVTTGNGLLGIALDERGNYSGGLLSLLHPFPLLVGALTVAMFALHGGLYLHMKTEGGTQRWFYGWIWHAWGVYLVLWNLTTMYALVKIPRATQNLEQIPWAIGIAVLNVLAMANIPRCVYLHKVGQAFVSSSLGIICQVFLVGVALFPNLVSASNDPDLSLTIYNAASSPKTLWIMLVIAIIGMPMVLGYTTVLYWTFRGKVTEDVYGH